MTDYKTYKVVVDGSFRTTIKSEDEGELRNRMQEIYGAGSRVEIILVKPKNNC